MLLKYGIEISDYFMKTLFFKTVKEVCNPLRNNSYSAVFSRYIVMVKPVDAQTSNELRISWLHYFFRDLRVNSDNFRILSLKSIIKVLHFSVREVLNSLERF